jgi:hypothetical protein
MSGEFVENGQSEGVLLLVGQMLPVECTNRVRVLLEFDQILIHFRFNFMDLEGMGEEYTIGKWIGNGET